MGQKNPIQTSSFSTILGTIYLMNQLGYYLSVIASDRTGKRMVDKLSVVSSRSQLEEKSVSWRFVFHFSILRNIDDFLIIILLLRPISLRKHFLKYLSVRSDFLFGTLFLKRHEACQCRGTAQLCSILMLLGQKKVVDMMNQLLWVAKNQVTTMVSSLI